MSSRTLLTTLILAGLVLGVIVGQLLHDPTYKLTMPESEHAHSTALAVFTFLGNTVFMSLLKMLIIPLVAVSVVVGVTSVGDFRNLGRIGGWTLTYYFSTMVIAVTIGLLLVTALRPGARIAEEQRRSAEVAYAEDEVSVKELEARQQEGLLGAVKGLVSQIIPLNVVGAAAGVSYRPVREVANTGQPLPIIFFSIFFGVVVTMIGPKNRIIIDFFDAVFEVLMLMVHAVIWLAPIGVFALLAWTVARIGLSDFGPAIGMYMATVFVGLGIHAFIVLPLLLWIFTRSSSDYASPFVFFHQMRQALMTAIGTDSSSATLPVTIECATEFGGVSKRSAGFVLPLGSTINMDGTALYEAVAVVFLAQAYGLNLGVTTLILIALTATLAAVGAAGIPSAGLVTMVIVLDAVNSSVLAADPTAIEIPIAAVGLIIGVDRILDMFRTATNVWGDAVGAKIMDRVSLSGS
jgi:Na+/H+-dicarboxylate symporter